jgi:uncharacterized protein YfaS (alpha-2-macroglobulin family)
LKRERIVRVLRVLLVSGVGVACAPGERPPSAPLRGTLALGGERAGKKDDGAFRVVFAAPHGEATSVAEMSIVFSRPLHALEVADVAKVPAITITPPIAGRWLWVGARGLRFVPETARLPSAHRFAVEVPGSVAAIDGTRLGAPYRFAFETPRPKVVTSTPRSGEEGLELATTFTLELSQPIDPVRFEKATTLIATQGEKRQALAFAAVRPDPREPKKIVVKPRAPLPKGSTITLQISDALVGEEGPLPTGEVTTLGYQTYGPLHIERVDCDTDTPHGGCAPGGPLGLSLTNPVRWKELRRAVTVTPGVKLRFGGGEEDDFTRYLDLSGAFEAGKAYTVTLAPDLTDRHGQALGKAESRSVTIDDFFPRAEIGLTGDTLLSSSVKPIQVGSVNVPKYRLTTSAIRPEDLPNLFAARTPDEKLLHVEKLPQAKQRHVTPGAAKNHVAKESVSPKDILGAEHGVLALGVSYDHDKRDSRSVDPFRLLKVTELAVSAKVSRHGSLVWVTRLRTGEPVKGASVELLREGAPSKRYETDASGFARVSADDYAPDLSAEGADSHATFVVRNGDDWTYEAVEDHLPEWRLPISVDLSGAQHAYGMMFTERGVYRPGDTVRLKGIVRQETPTGNATLAGRKVDVVLRSPDDEEVSRTPVTTTRFGTFSANVVVPASASLGSFQLRAEGLGTEDTVYDSFEVAEYRPSEFKVTAESGAPSYVHGTTARWTVRGDYLFGAPMAGASVHYSVTRGPTWFSVPDTDGFSTDSSAYYAELGESALSAGEIAAADAKLDAHGALGFDAKLALPGQRGTEMVRVDAEVTDVSRQAISSSAAAIVHPADFYVGLAVPEDAFVSTPGDISARVLALTPEGKRLSGKRVHVDLVQRRWTLAREQLKGGESHAVTKVVDRVAGGCDVVTGGAEPSACALHVEASGYYVIVARGKDGHGNAAEAAYGMYATGGAGASWGDSDRGLVELVPNKKQYKIGDIARVLVKSPFAEAEALVTVERAGVYHAERVTLRGATPMVSVPITDDLRPNAFVSVHLLRAMNGKGKGTGPYYRVGYAALSIDAEARRLSVDVKPRKKELLPGEEVTIDLVARGKGGKPARAELTVYAVDEGVLMLTGYKTPDPLPVFTAPRALQVATLETRESMAKISLDAFDGALGSAKGADGGGGGEAGTRHDFRQTAYFNPSVMTDESGHARVTFKLPESLTTFRVMAVATTEGDQYGFGQANVVTSRRLMARPNLPRFFRAGDRVEAGIVVSSKGLPKSQVTVRATVTGLVFDGAAAAAPGTASSEKVIELAKDESVEVRFPLRADTVGEAKFRFDVQAGTERDAVLVTRRVAAPGTFETVALYGSTEKTSAEALGDYSTIRHDTGGLAITLAPSALVGLDGGAAQLVEYPYACTEQLSSRLLPLLPLRDLATAFGFALPPDVNGVVGRTIAEILSRQRGDGGFGMWPESNDSTPWISAYATWVLDQAASHGARISKKPRDRAHDYLRRTLALLDGEHARLATAAFMVDVLADAGLPDPGYMARLFESRKELPTFGRGFLLHALAVGKGPGATVKELAGELSSELRITSDSAFVAENIGDEYAVLLDSEARTGAIVLRGLLAADPKHALASQLARGLVSQRAHGTWRSTQETAFALIALDAYRRAQEAAPARFTAKVWLGEKTIRSTSFNGKLVADHSFVELAKLPEALSGALVFEKDGPGKLFYETRLKYVRATLPAAPLDAGFFVQKALRAVEPSSLSAALGTIADAGVTRFGAGNLVLADLVVVTPSPRDYVVIDDPLPAGFEAVDAGLATTAAWLDVPGSSSTADQEGCEGCESGRDAQAHGRAFLDSWYRREVRDDRVLFFVDHMAAGMYHYRYLARATSMGTFVVPPTKAEEMYTPETFGRTGAEMVVVQ